jgi:glycosyltransferase involved in cell wall biosynthesis
VPAACTDHPKIRLAVVAGHPVQYVAPWLQQLAHHTAIELKVFYLWNLGVSKALDPGFQKPLQWDIPLLKGYEHTFIPNLSFKPGNHHFFGYINPSINKVLQRWNPDAILLMNYAFFSYWMLLFDPAFQTTPFLFRGDSHDLNRSKGPRARLSRFLRGLIFKRFSAFLVVGEANRAYYRSCGVPTVRLLTASHAVDNDRFLSAADQARSEAEMLRLNLGISEAKVVILFVGKFVSVKRTSDILEAYASLSTDLRNQASLVFVGDGPLGASLARSSERAGLTDVHILPLQNQQAMPAIYALGDVLVLASQSETWGLVVNEAMNLGCPAIVSDHVGCRGDLVVEGMTGWIYPTGNVAALTRCMGEAISDPERLRAMGVAAREHVQAFNFDSITTALQEALRRTAGSK